MFLLMNALNKCLSEPCLLLDYIFNLIIQFLECYWNKFTFATVCETWHYFQWLQKWYPQPKVWEEIKLNF